MNRLHFLAVAWTVFAGGVLVMSVSSRADEVQLANGDTVKGHVVSLDEKTLKLKSEILGELTIERKNVRAIQLYDDAVRVPANSKGVGELQGARKPPAGSAPGGDKSSSFDDLLKQIQKPGGGIDTEALLKRFEAEGGNADALGEMKKNLPLFGAPKVQGYVEKQLKGLADGSLKIDDIRNQAIHARDETRKAIKDLGPGAENALAPYLGILDKFIKDTEPPAGSKPATKPAEAKPAK